jgi:phosphate transport system protein
MAGMAEQAIQRSVEAYRVRDISICDLVDDEGHAIQRFEREIDQMALDLLAMDQPVANDLRFTLAVIKINADLTRAGKAARSISHRVRDLQTLPVVDLPADIPRMALLDQRRGATQSSENPNFPIKIAGSPRLEHPCWTGAL